MRGNVSQVNTKLYKPTSGNMHQWLTHLEQEVQHLPAQVAYGEKPKDLKCA